MPWKAKITSRADGKTNLELRKFDSLDAYIEYIKANPIVEPGKSNLDGRNGKGSKHNFGSDFDGGIFKNVNLGKDVF